MNCENSWDCEKEIVVYKDDKFILGQKDGVPYLSIMGKAIKLSCQPYEPCLYMNTEDGRLTIIHNAFKPFDVLEAFYNNKSIISITGFEYNVLDFCKMLEYAQRFNDISIDIAEQVLEKKEKVCSKMNDSFEKEDEYIIHDSFLSSIMSKYDACVVDYCLVKNESEFVDCNSHKLALFRACNELFVYDDYEDSWQFDVGKATGAKVETNEVFIHEKNTNKLNYYTAFLFPPYGSGCKSKDFDFINSILFPKGINELDVYEWSTDWSDYFDDGHEWWGTLCYTIYDKKMNRYVVIIASATD